MTDQSFSKGGIAIRTDNVFMKGDVFTDKYLVANWIIYTILVFSFIANKLIFPSF